ncbi:MAG: formylglycine-generating enzyme family protein [Victivallaceae bacterium]|nr:formylglycine-generating enzyme family protein [Victivallaceae bacterium]
MRNRVFKITSKLSSPFIRRSMLNVGCSTFRRSRLYSIFLFGCATLSLLTSVVAGDKLQQITTKSGIKMVLIPGGTFMLGSTKGKADEKPVHKVKVSSFYMDVYEVTQAAYMKMMDNNNPSRFKNKKGAVERVRWTDAIRYCNARSKAEGLEPVYDIKTGKCDFSKNGYRLPTEAEWEYASRAGSKGEHFFTGGIAVLGRYAWFRKNSREKVHPVGKKRPNAFGVYDMYGNVLEWCNDNYSKDYYAISPIEDPRGPATGKKKVLRGGSWASRGKYCRNAARKSDNPTTADICQGYDTYGFRCVRKTPVK